MRGASAIGAVLLLGSLVLWHATDGLQAFTTESARRLAVARTPRALPDPLLQDQADRDLRLSDLRGRLVLAQFIFTRCATLCLASADSFAQIAERLAAGRRGEVVLLSLSFDPVHDGPDELADYAARFGADGETWRIARVADPRDLPQLLESFGVVVIPDPIFGFQHNAAQHLIDRDGRLARILDFDATDAALRVLAP